MTQVILVTGELSARASVLKEPRRDVALGRAPAGDDTGQGGHGRGGGRRLLARQEVEPHWKRQAYGPRRSRRQWIVIDRYEREPAPEDDQIVVTRLPERRREDGLKR